jgi:hypothetical protein
MDIVILAGGACSPEMKEATGVDMRADIKFKGRTCLDITADALSPFGGIIAVGGPSSDKWTTVPAGKGFIDSLKAGLAKCTEDQILICTVDLPCLTKEAVAEFLGLCGSADLHYPIIREEDTNAQFPGVKRTIARLKEGRFTGGNLALVKREGADKLIDLMNRVYDSRKSPLKLAKLVGIGTALRLIVAAVIPGALTLGGLEETIGKIMGLKIRTVTCHDASIGADVDSAEQLQALEAIKNTANSPD